MLILMKSKLKNISKKLADFKKCGNNNNKSTASLVKNFLA